MQSLLLSVQKAAPHPPPGPVPSFGETLRSLAFGGAPAWGRLLGSGAHLAANLFIAAIIFAFTLWAARTAARLASEAMARLHRGRRPDAILQSFVGSLARYGVMIIGIIAVLQQLGVRTTSVIAVLGAASLAIGLALQGGLSNVAAGVMILLLRPYRVGDRVEIAGKVGRVRGLDLFMTRLTDLDNLYVFIPNSKAFGDTIVNYTMPPSRRIQMDFKIDFEDDVDLALEALLKTARADGRIVDDPAPWAKVTKLGDSAITVSLRAWCEPIGFVDTRLDLIKACREALVEVGITFAYPHQVAVESRPWKPPRPKDARRSAAERREVARAAAQAPADGEPPPEGKPRRRRRRP
ncbi:MAG TPA: mechanosensitive ion channel family protein [Caulobacteraceae bacterium]|nr:mechanosensitive ion channel family protein [Caulobacteraceae bacterium]